jgi:hypothetical protein
VRGDAAWVGGRLHSGKREAVRHVMSGRMNNTYGRNCHIERTKMMHRVTQRIARTDEDREDNTTVRSNAESTRPRLEPSQSMGTEVHLGVQGRYTDRARKYLRRSRGPACRWGFPCRARPGRPVYEAYVQ